MTKQAKFSPRYYLTPRNLPCGGIDSVIDDDIWPFDIENRNSHFDVFNIKSFCNSKFTVDVTQFFAFFVLSFMQAHGNMKISFNN